MESSKGAHLYSSKECKAWSQAKVREGGKPR